MTGCNDAARDDKARDDKPILFSSPGRRRVPADFSGGDITGDGGALLPREVDRHPGLTARPDAALPGPRDPSRVAREQRHVPAQRVFAVAPGHEDCNDHHDLRLDPLMQAVAGRGVDREQPPASPTTPGRLENRVAGKGGAGEGMGAAAAREALLDMASVPVEVFIASHDEPPAELVPDLDATGDTARGNQAGRFFHGYCDGCCSLPLYVFCGDHLLVAYPRPGDIDAAKHSRAILKLPVDRSRKAWPLVKVTARADSGFCRWRLTRWCDRHDVYHVPGLARNKSPERLSEGALLRARPGYEETGEKRRLFDEFEYAAGTWDRPRRTILRHEHDARGPDPRHVVPNVPAEGAEARDLDGKTCRARGGCGNRIKEQQPDLFAGRTSCHGFLPDQFRVLLGAAAYVLIDHLRRRGLKGTAMQEAQAGAIRLRLLKVGARAVHSVRRLVLQMGGGYPPRDVFAAVARRLAALPALPRAAAPAG